MACRPNTMFRSLYGRIQWYRASRCVYQQNAFYRLFPISGGGQGAFCAHYSTKSQGGSRPGSLPQTGINLDNFEPEAIRNFCIIAHIDHGKTTLSDAILTTTETITDGGARYLDKLQVEKERGITVKAQTATMTYTHNDRTYLLNLIDTPGHVDFTYEVGRSMMACSGAILLVDAAQGVQAQTLANLELAMAHDLFIIPAITKIDTPLANVEECKDQIELLFDYEREDIICTSAHAKLGIHELLQAVIDRIPGPIPPTKAPSSSSDDNLSYSDDDGPSSAMTTNASYTRVLLFDAWHHLNAVRMTCLVNVERGALKKGDAVMSYATGKKYSIQSIGIMNPEPVMTGKLLSGQVGFVDLGMTTKKEALVGDTLFLANEVSVEEVEPFPGFRLPNPKVFASLYPTNSGLFRALEGAVDKLCCSDASVSVSQEESDSLGLGLRCGFLGILHMNIFSQRLLQEFGAEVIITPPSVVFKAVKSDGTEVDLATASAWQDRLHFVAYKEPMVILNIITPQEYAQELISLCENHRGEQVDIVYSTFDKVSIKYRIPLNEIIQTFYNKLKAISRGYASMDYEEDGFHTTDLVKVELLLNGQPVDCLSHITHKTRGEKYAKALVAKMQGLIPRQMVDVIIQAKVGKKVVARDVIKQLRKDVTAKCYGGDMTRKRKLLDRQKEGKKKMREIWKVQIPEEVFVEVMKLDR